MTAVATATGIVRGGPDDGTTLFAGIPYAAPARRFAPPEPPVPWDGVREARTFGPPAAQRPGRMAWVPGLEIDPETGRENCLTLNVWTPGASGTSGVAGGRPVLVFLHGGAFVFGSGAQPMYRGTVLARDHGMVVVTVNYRLGVLGFGYDDEIPANLGLRDQVAALEWVRANIAAFGGDPDRITLAGHSAGGMSVLALMAAPSARGLFHRAAVMSALPYGFATETRARAFTTAFRRALGRAQPRSAPLRAVLAAEGEAAKSLPPVEGVLPVAPVVDGSFLPRHPMDAVRSGAVPAVPLLVTTTAEEMRLFAAIDPATLSASDARTELVWRRPADELARWHAAHGGEVHRVTFTHRSPHVHRGVPIGAAHLADVPFHLGTLHDRRLAPLTGAGPDVTALGAEITAAFADFCHGRETVPCRTRSASRSSDRATSAPI
ncbi:carboxylesterase/lipase family protein [Actinomadura oligospora]|uniref:carboxylesterase/lipase family protein n=1 Tax=Actinomadura oligospora TaxID=111804 RepID=UPI0004B14D83|nr:carboxylesterase family protein [Actinomadura oligospora]